MLKKEFVKNNKGFKQVLETSNFFIYQITAYGNDNYQDIYYEVFKKKLQMSEDEISDFKDFFLQGNTRVPLKRESV